MKLNINGQLYSVPDGPDRELLWVLHDELGLPIRFGCTVGMCGTCLVLVDGKSTRACCYPVSAVGDRPVWTRQGLLEAKARGEGPAAVPPASGTEVMNLTINGQDHAVLDAAVSVPAQAGDVVLFHLWTVHGSALNRAGRWRRLVRVGYRDPRNQQIGGAALGRPGILVKGVRPKVEGVEVDVYGNWTPNPAAAAVLEG